MKVSERSLLSKHQNTICPNVWTVQYNNNMNINITLKLIYLLIYLLSLRLWQVDIRQQDRSIFDFERLLNSLKSEITELNWLK